MLFLSMRAGEGRFKMGRTGLADGPNMTSLSSTGQGAVLGRTDTGAYAEMLKNSPVFQRDGARFHA
jgi:hypothetical protein